MPKNLGLNRRCKFKKNVFFENQEFFLNEDNLSVVFLWADIVTADVPIVMSS